MIDQIEFFFERFVGLVRQNTSQMTLIELVDHGQNRFFAGTWKRVFISKKSEKIEDKRKKTDKNLKN